MSDEGSGSRDAGRLVVHAYWERPAIGPGGGEARLLVRIETRGAASARAPLDLALVVDRSGSMAGGKLDLAKQAIDEALRRLGDDDRVAVVAYDDQIDLLQELAPATPRVVARSRLLLAGIEPRGATNLAGGWLTGCRELTLAPAEQGRVRRALLLTDGQANVGVVDPGELAARAAELRRMGIGTTTLGLGLGFDEDLLSAMAEAGGGNFHFIADAGELAACFDREARELTAIAGLGVTFGLSLPPGMTAELLNALPTEARANGLVVNVGDVALGATIDLVFAIHFDPSPVGTVRRLGASLRWTNATGASRRRDFRSPAVLTFADDQLACAAADPLVAEQAALQLAARERRAALRLDRAGEIAASRARMRRAADALAAAPPSAAIRDRLVETQILASRATAYDEATRKRAQADASRDRRGVDGESAA
ncbi:MAG TPA: VWA domain-containing protein [Thermomicrobiales bacterium]|nr:VWA domain-containing protein [Thermomicrobiales bacterium]